MRKTISIFTTVLLAGLALMVQRHADASVMDNPNGYNAFAGAGTAQGTTNAYFVVGTATTPGFATPIVRYLNVSSDSSSSKIQFYTLTNKINVVNGTNSGTTNFVCSSTNMFAAGDIVVIKHVAAETYEALPVWLVQNTNQIVVKFAPANQVNVGDLIWKAGPTGAIPIGAATNSVPTGAGLFLYAGQYGTPLLIQIAGSSTVGINAVAGDFR